MDVSDVCGSVMVSEETWVILGRGHMYTSSRGWVFPFLSMLEVCVWLRALLVMGRISPAPSQVLSLSWQIHWRLV